MLETYDSSLKLKEPEVNACEALGDRSLYIKFASALVQAVVYPVILSFVEEFIMPFFTNLSGTLGFVSSSIALSLLLY